MAIPTTTSTMPSTISSMSSTMSAMAAATSAMTSSRTTMADNFDTFLTLLTTQLQNQNPLDPLDTNQFTQQLVQFASVEQQIKTNETLEALVTVSKAAQTTSALGLIGAKVTAEGTTTSLANGKAEWSFSASKPGIAIVSVLDNKGNTVLTKEVSVSAGQNTFAWDGKSSTGSMKSDGLYTIQVAARDAAGQSFAVTSEITGVVDGVDIAGTTPMLTMGSVSVALEKVRSVRRL